MEEEQLKREDRESRRETLLKLLSTLIGLTISVAGSYVTSFKKDPISELSEEFGTVLALAFGAVLVQAILAIYLRQRTTLGSELKRKVQTAYKIALEKSALNPQAKG